jgi:hypothetical protein
VELADGSKLVVRIGSKDNFQTYDNAIYWRETLRPLGLPMPEFFEYSNDPAKSEYPYIIMKRLEGKDLHDVYPDLLQREKRVLAWKMVGIQQRVNTQLPTGNGYGFASRLDSTNLHKSWFDLLLWHIERSRQWIQQGEKLSEKFIDDVKAVLIENKPLFEDVPPTPFLDDITTKNVIVYEGKLNGIIDIDWIGFGDPLFTPALTKVSLLFSGYDTEYVDFWLEQLDLNENAMKRFELYTALFCANLIAEQGLKFNKDHAEPVDLNKVEQYQSILYSFIQ